MRNIQLKVKEYHFLHYKIYIYEIIKKKQQENIACNKNPCRFFVLKIHTN